MNTYQCLIVDDERLARELIDSYLQKIPYLKVVAICSSAIEAMQVLQSQQIDLLFLDIQMPNLTGIDFLRSLKDPPLTILTTAYSEFALEGYELSVVDYLLKPVEFDRFFKAISKAMERLEDKKPMDAQQIIATGVAEKGAEDGDYFFIKVDHKILKINRGEVLYIEADQKYVHIYTEQTKHFTLLSLSKILESLPQSKFIRIHRSFIVNIDKIDSIEGNTVRIKEHKIPISKGQRDAFMEVVKKKGFF